MLNVGDKPLLETIVCSFVNQGFQNIWLAVNYHSKKIENETKQLAQLKEQADLKLKEQAKEVAKAQAEHAKL